MFTGVPEIVRSLEEFLPLIPIKDIMSTDVTYVAQGSPIYEALDLLTKRKISGLPVVDAHMHVVGILSEKDVLRLLIDKNVKMDGVVDDYMTREVVCFPEDGDAIEVCKFFIRSHIRRVPIVQEGKLIGIVSRRDIVRLILEAHRKISAYRFD